MKPMSGISSLLVLALASGCAPKGPAPAAMVAAADSVDQHFIAAFNKSDGSEIMSLYWNSPELVSIGLDGMGVQGWDATKASWDKTLTDMAGAKLEFIESHNLPAGDAVLGWGRWRATIPTPNGSQVLEGRYSDVKEFKDGKMVVVMDHGSVPMPPAPAAAPTM
jgi:ketosteroid isomerase-like protein